MPLVVPCLNRVIRRPSHGTLARVTSGRFYKNLLLQSINQNNASWGVSALTSRLRDAIAPDGVANNATTMVENSNNNDHHLSITPSPTIAAGTLLTFSCWGKRGSSGTRDFALTLLGTGGANYIRKFFNLGTGAVGTSTVVGDGRIINSGIKASGNSFYRMWFTGVFSTSVTLVAARIAMTSGETYAYAGDGASSIIVWGAQLQTDFYPSNLIRTTTTQLTQEETENLYGN